MLASTQQMVGSAGLPGSGETSAGCFSNTAVFNVVSAFPEDWTPRSPWVAREQLPRLQSRLLLLFQALRALGQ